MAYCKWLSEREKASYRLPTEAEWEYACRSGSTTKFSFGDDYAELKQYAWFRGRPGRPGLLRNRVASRRPNAFGLFDMHGSVREFCHHDPGSPNRILRSGSWNTTPFECRSAFRIDLPTPGSDDIGFRIVRDW